jgi:hypothetical protein
MSGSVASSASSTTSSGRRPNALRDASACSCHWSVWAASAVSRSSLNKGPRRAQSADGADVEDVRPLRGRHLTSRSLTPTPHSGAQQHGGGEEKGKAGYLPDPGTMRNETFSRGAGGVLIQDIPD